MENNPPPPPPPSRISNLKFNYNIRIEGKTRSRETFNPTTTTPDEYSLNLEII